MLHSLVVGLGRCGAGLHVPALRRARGHPTPAPPFADAPIIGVDPRRPAPIRDLVVADDLAHAARLAPPELTVAHVCTPPTVRTAVIERLARLGYRRMLVEKPLATDPATLDALEDARRRWGLRLAVVSHWLASALTDRIRGYLADGSLGPLRSLAIVQRKPRFDRSRWDTGHATAFDVELPHSVVLALALAGPAELDTAGSRDLWIDGTVRGGLGAAWVTLRHASGVRTTILSELTAPVRERRVTASLAHGVLTGHYPCSDADQHAQLRVCTGPPRREPAVFADDALTAFVLRTYTDLGSTDLGSTDLGSTDPRAADRAVAGTSTDDTYALHRRVVGLLHEARTRAPGGGPVIRLGGEAAPTLDGLRVFARHAPDAKEAPA